MAWFNRDRKSAEPDEAGVQSEGIHPIVGRNVYCRVCDAMRPFSRCWRRVKLERQCQCCGLVFDEPRKIYSKFQPTCPRCGEFLEQPGFDYGLCDGCGSKYEVVEGTKPGWLPNRQQREELNKFGRSWRPD